MQYLLWIRNNSDPSLHVVPDPDSVADPVPFWPIDPGSGMGKNQDQESGSGSGMNILDYNPGA
jgi:hypothetical protein